MTAVENAFIERFGPYAGWAHSVLFISDLASIKQYLPENLRPSETPNKKRKSKDLAERDIQTLAFEGKFYNFGQTNKSFLLCALEALQNS